MCVYVCICVCAYVCVCVRECVCVLFIFKNKIYVYRGNAESRPFGGSVAGSGIAHTLSGVSASVHTQVFFFVVFFSLVFF